MKIRLALLLLLSLVFVVGCSGSEDKVGGIIIKSDGTYAHAETSSPSYSLTQDVQDTTSSVEVKTPDDETTTTIAVTAPPVIVDAPLETVGQTSTAVAAVTEVTTVPQSTQAQTDVSISAEEIENIVYWTSGGEVWHTSLDCPSLSRSKQILSGSVDEAVASGKDRVCKRCG